MLENLPVRTLLASAICAAVAGLLVTASYRLEVEGAGLGIAPACAVVAYAFYRAWWSRLLTFVALVVFSLFIGLVISIRVFDDVI